MLAFLGLYVLGPVLVRRAPGNVLTIQVVFSALYFDLCLWLPSASLVAASSDGTGTQQASCLPSAPVPSIYLSPRTTTLRCSPEVALTPNLSTISGEPSHVSIYYTSIRTTPHTNHVFRW
ncbi:hypothetical protein PV04_04899 [Phialophora macrospora]|uniref:Uncharacterized protein n=1 Tax=Phialophora macrospora TaxID=1851006 RepID=A0A0D2GAK2_9EURO|nr:hypothetical protein PV04_04899 [Phialophora macrospora]